MKGFLLTAIPIGGLCIAAAVGALMPDATSVRAEKAATEKVAKTSAADAANIGDVVDLLYPHSTIMCKDKTDAEKVYLSGEITLRQTYRLKNNMTEAYRASTEARKNAMATAYSCRWAASTKTKTYVVNEKEVIGDNNSALYVASYCLKSDSSDRCWWIEETATWSPQIVRVRAKEFQ